MSHGPGNPTREQCGCPECMPQDEVSDQLQEVKVGQVWKDRDKRLPNPRFVRVIGLGQDRYAVKFALCQRCDEHGKSVTHRVTQIKLRRFRPTATGYDLCKNRVTEQPGLARKADNIGGYPERCVHSRGLNAKCASCDGML